LKKKRFGYSEGGEEDIRTGNRKGEEDAAGNAERKC
jgi:hypothetical protein